MKKSGMMKQIKFEVERRFKFEMDQVAKSDEKFERPRENFMCALVYLYL